MEEEEEGEKNCSIAAQNGDSCRVDGKREGSKNVVNSLLISILSLEKPAITTRREETQLSIFLLKNSEQQQQEKKFRSNTARKWYIELKKNGHRGFVCPIVTFHV